MPRFQQTTWELNHWTTITFMGMEPTTTGIEENEMIQHGNATTKNSGEYILLYYLQIYIYMYIYSIQWKHVFFWFHHEPWTKIWCCTQSDWWVPPHLGSWLLNPHAERSPKPAVHHFPHGMVFFAFVCFFLYVHIQSITINHIYIYVYTMCIYIYYVCIYIYIYT